MWNRIVRLFRSIFGGIIDKAEDPELVLQQLVRDMRDNVPKLNNQVAQVIANEKLLSRQLEQAQAKVTELDSKIKAAIKMGRDDIATQWIGELQTTQRGLDLSKTQLVQAKSQSEKALQLRDSYMAQMKKKSDEAMQLIAQSKQAKMQEQIAQTMTSFQVGDDSGTLDDMREKITRRAAEAEAKAEMATNTIDTKMQEIELEAANIEAQDSLLAYKRQMGLIPDSPSNALGEGSPVMNTEKTLGGETAPVRPQAAE